MKTSKENLDVNESKYMYDRLSAEGRLLPTNAPVENVSVSSINSINVNYKIDILQVG